MKALLRVLLGALALTFALPAVAAELKLGFVNAARVLKSAPQAEAALNRLEKEFSPRDKALVEAQKALRKLEDKLSKDSATLSDADFVAVTDAARRRHPPHRHHPGVGGAQRRARAARILAKPP